MKDLAWALSVPSQLVYTAAFTRPLYPPTVNWRLHCIQTFTIQCDGNGYAAAAMGAVTPIDVVHVRPVRGPLHSQNSSNFQDLRP